MYQSNYNSATDPYEDDEDYEINEFDDDDLGPDATEIRDQLNDFYKMMN